MTFFLNKNIKGITIEIGGDTTGLNKALDGVNTVTFKNKEKALESFKESMKNYKDADLRDRTYYYIGTYVMMNHNGI